MGSETRACQNCKNQFVIEPDDFGFYSKIGVPPPTYCSECRRLFRMMFRNDRTFYRRKCDLCGGNIISVYREDVAFPVYCQKCWWSDKWDPYSYGKEFDFSKSFFDQFKKLLDRVPSISIVNDNGVSSVNCEYTYDWFYSKNCYMDVAGWHAENVLYSYHIEHNKDLMDSAHMRESELTYECLQCYKLNRCSYCTYCSSCQDCFLSYDLQGCSSCVMCIGLRNKKYCIKNQQYSKEDYEKKIKELRLDDYDSVENLKKEFQDFSLKFPHKYAYILRSVYSTGDFVINCKNCKHSFMAIHGENLKFMYGTDTAKDTYDCDMTGKSELCYNCMVADEARKNLCTVFCFHSNDVAYSHYCPSAEWCFGCVGLKKGSYAVLNKKYSKEEYEKLKEKIVNHMEETGEWGEFFPHWISPFAYNETAAQELSPLTKTEVQTRGYRWLEPEPRSYSITVRPEDLTDKIADTTDSILEQVIGCAHQGSCNHKCTTAFKVVRDELNLYRKLNVPVPHLCPNCRHFERLGRRNPINLWHRQCMCDYQIYKNTMKHNHHLEGRCPNEFETSYASDRPEIVYCEQCYNAEVV